MNNLEPFYEIPAIANLKDMLEQSVIKYENNDAFRIKDKEGSYYGISYRKLKHDVDALGTAFITLGLLGERVAVMGQNSYNWCVSYLATICGNGVVVPIDKELPMNDIANILNVSEAKAIVFSEKHLKDLVDIKSELNPDLIMIDMDNIEDSKYESILNFYTLVDRGREMLANGDTAYSQVQIDAESMKFLLFTSGTTGMAKGVMLCHRNICANIMSVSQVVKVEETDSTLSILPLHHTYECTLGFLLIIYHGGCISFCEGLKYISKNVKEVKPSVLISVPLLLENIHSKIMDKVSKTSGSKLKFKVGITLTKTAKLLGKDIRKKIFKDIHDSLGGRLRMVISGAAAISPTVVRDFTTFGFRILQGYGLTECSPLLVGNNDRFVVYDSIGLPIPGVDVKIVNEDAHGIGEIIARGANIMLGYFNDKESTDKVLKDGWFYTGDLGNKDKDGFFRITGRSKNVIVTKNGKNIYPEEVELYLNDSPLIHESLVWGDLEEHTDDTTVSAHVFPNIDAIKEKLGIASITADDIRKAISEVIKEVNKKLPLYKNIKKFDIRENEFIKTTTKKIKRYIHK